MNSWHPLHFLEQNLPLASAVLENPTRNRFKRELINGNYNIIAMTFTVISA
ncbi:MAG: hypothetical protein JXB50_07225 [Spirochaetes bacterium]|nr:hypothetical protein [Spirochaetota bacterium]